ncbi:uncharacterized protein H6S33_001038 [Morchella sextelata]|uniref:uncharacterized protein n=1 Tax=Morchella sextelata TaxID=1174677 RepID=UPI001D0457A1|nr:uncharacterized protein H6S33_001038 [Morchella sextelata]KAH0608810.1 hypothetical protein H6S33_001038 [Morchella sextelata]
MIRKLRPMSKPLVYPALALSQATLALLFISRVHTLPLRRWEYFLPGSIKRDGDNVSYCSSNGVTAILRVVHHR